MFHSNTEQLIDYWQTRRIAGRTPSRASINPVDFAELLPQVFMLGRRRAGEYRVRLAGGFIADLHGRELQGEDFLRLWEPSARTPLQLALEAVRRHPEPLVIDAEARVSNNLMRAEILVAPLTSPTGDLDRLIGLYQPLTPVSALRGGVVHAMRICNINTTTPMSESFPRLRLAAIDGRQIA